MRESSFIDCDLQDAAELERWLRRQQPFVDWFLEKAARSPHRDDLITALDLLSLVPSSSQAAMDLLLSAMDSPDNELVLKALACISAKGVDTQRSLLAPLLRHNTWYIRSAAIDLAFRTKRDFDALSNEVDRLLADRHPTCLMQLIECATHCGVELPWVTCLTDSLSPEWNGCKRAVCDNIANWRVCPPEAAHAVQRLLDENDVSLQSAALSAAVQHGLLSAESLTKYLNHIVGISDDGLEKPLLRLFLSCEEARCVLLEIAKHGRSPLRQVAAIKWCAVLSGFGPNRLEELLPLRGVVQQDVAFYVNAAVWIGTGSDSDSYHATGRALSDVDLAKQRFASYAFARRRPASAEYAESILRNALSRDGRTRRASIVAMRRWGLFTESTIETLFTHRAQDTFEALELAKMLIEAVSRKRDGTEQ